MIRVFRSLFIGLVFLFLGAVFFSSLRPYPSYLPLIALCAGAVGLVVSLLDDRAALIALGISLCLLPIFGPGVLNIFVLGWVVGFFFLRAAFGYTHSSADLSGSKELASWAFFALIIPLLCAVGYTLSLEFDGTIITAIVKRGGVGGVFEYLSTSSVTWHRALTVSSGAVLAGFVFFAVLAISNAYTGFIHLSWGIAIGVIGSLIYLTLQVLEFHPFFFQNMNPFWRYVGRFPGSFTDPNAFGMMSMLILPILIVLTDGRRGVFFGPLAVFLFFFTIWSGSRTFYLGLGIWLVIYLAYQVAQTGRRQLQLGFWLGVLSLVIFVCLLGYPPINRSLQERMPFPGPVRVLKTINWDEAEGMFASRQIYTKIAYAAWRKSPLTGLGLERFYNEQERVLSEIGVDVGTWRDNANNFYLQVLVEQGALGLGLNVVAFALFAFVILSPERRTIIDVDKVEPVAVRKIFSVCRTLLFVTAIALITGPHVYFDEVRFLVMVILAVSVSRPILIRREFLQVIRVAMFGIILLFPPVFYTAVSAGVGRRMSSGFYPQETAGGGKIAWSVDRSRLYLCKTDGDSVTISVRDANPNPGKDPVRVALWEENPLNPRQRVVTLDPAKIAKAKLTNNEWTEIVIPLEHRGLG